MENLKVRKFENILSKIKKSCLSDFRWNFVWELFRTQTNSVRTGNSVRLADFSKFVFLHFDHSGMTIFDILVFQIPGPKMTKNRHFQTQTFFGVWYTLPVGIVPQDEKVGWCRYRDGFRDHEYFKIRIFDISIFSKNTKYVQTWKYERLILSLSEHTVATHKTTHANTPEALYTRSIY